MIPSFEEFSVFCERATDHIKHLIENTTLSISTKADGTSVTNVDLVIEDCLRDSISKEYPDHSILGEERKFFFGKSEYTWVIDPIDGTLGFSRGVPMYGTLIGLMHADIPQYGFMRLPMIGDARLCGHKKGSFLNGKPVYVKNHSEWNNSIVVTTDEKTLRASPLNTLWNDVLSRGATARTWGDCYGYYLLCTGKVDMMADTGLKPVDILPIVPILEGAGATLETYGSEKYENLAAFSNGARESLG